MCHNTHAPVTLDTAEFEEKQVGNRRPVPRPGVERRERDMRQSRCDFGPWRHSETHLWPDKCWSKNLNFWLKSLLQITIKGRYWSHKVSRYMEKAESRLKMWWWYDMDYSILNCWNNVILQSSVQKMWISLRGTILNVIQYDVKEIK